MRYTNSDTSGFTIVELLIVVVVIAILAAITIVSYNGITARTNDTAVQSDLSSMAKKLQLYYADNGSYPNTTIEANVRTAFDGFKASKGSYVTSGTNVNLIYCTNASQRDQFALIGWSKSSSSKGYYITNSRPISEFNYALSDGATVCGNAGIPATLSWMWMYDVLVASGWRTWI